MMLACVVCFDVALIRSNCAITNSRLGKLAFVTVNTERDAVQSIRAYLSLSDKGHLFIAQYQTSQRSRFHNFASTSKRAISLSATSLRSAPVT